MRDYILLLHILRLRSTAYSYMSAGTPPISFTMPSGSSTWLWGFTLPGPRPH